MKHENTTEFEFEMTNEILTDLFEITEDLMVIYAEEKIMKGKTPTLKQLILEVELSVINFLESCNNIMNYSVQKTEAYYVTMSGFVKKLSVDVLAYIEIGQQ